jgi:hypothetical protein
VVINNTELKLIYELEKGINHALGSKYPIKMIKLHLTLLIWPMKG